MKKNSIIACLFSIIHTLFFAMELVPREVQKQIASFVIDNDDERLLQLFAMNNLKNNTEWSCNKAWSLLAYAHSKLHYEKHNSLAQWLKYIDWQHLSVEQGAVLQKMFGPRKISSCFYANENLAVYFTEVHCNKDERKVIDTIPSWALHRILPEKEHMIVKSQFSLNKKQLLYDGIDMVDYMLHFDVYNAIKKIAPHIMIMLPYSFHEHYEIYKEDGNLQIKKFNQFILE